jgi:hypothetical protein
MVVVDRGRRDRAADAAAVAVRVGEAIPVLAGGREAGGEEAHGEIVGATGTGRCARDDVLEVRVARDLEVE